MIEKRGMRNRARGYVREGSPEIECEVLVRVRGEWRIESDLYRRLKRCNAEVLA